MSAAPLRIALLGRDERGGRDEPLRDWTTPFSHLAPAARLRRLADAELAHGHELRAEFLEGQAAALPAVSP